VSTPQGFSADPVPTNINRVRDGVACWFGGIYDPITRSYNNPQVRGLGTVRRARPKVQSDEEYYLGAAQSGSLIGSTMLVHLDTWSEKRVAISGAFGGLKLIQAACVLHVFMVSRTEFAEDAQDGFYELLDGDEDSLSLRIRQDRCMGTGGFEAGGFQCGEGGAPSITWQIEPADVSSEMTSAYASCSFNIDFFRQG
jgi:hypothetical protein